MKPIFKWIILSATTLVISLTPVISEAGHHCKWKNGQKVCWHTGKHHCYWVKSHWSHGKHIKAHKVCR